MRDYLCKTEHDDGWTTVQAATPEQAAELYADLVCRDEMDWTIFGEPQEVAVRWAAMGLANLASTMTKEAMYTVRLVQREPVHEARLV